MFKVTVFNGDQILWQGKFHDEWQAKQVKEEKEKLGYDVLIEKKEND